MLEETGVFGGMNLPAEIGGLRLEAVGLGGVFATAVFLRGRFLAIH